MMKGNPMTDTRPTAQSEIPDLLPCPFCGGRGDIKQILDDGRLFVGCYQGNMFVNDRKPKCPARHLQVSPETWNIRADLTNPTVTPIDPDMSADQLRLHMGELTAEEVRVARAAIRLANSMGSSASKVVTPEAAREALQGFNSWAHFPIPDGDDLQQLAHIEKVTRIRRTISDVLLNAAEGAK